MNDVLRKDQKDALRVNTLSGEPDPIHSSDVECWFRLFERLDAARAKAERMAESFKAYVNWNGPAHETDCPGDDTCDCRGKAINDSVNSVLGEHDKGDTSDVRLFIVFKYLEDRTQCFCGAFTDVGRAIDACDTDEHWIGPAVLNDGIEGDDCSWPGAWYPRRQKRPA